MPLCIKECHDKCPGCFLNWLYCCYVALDIAYNCKLVIKQDKCSTNKPAFHLNFKPVLSVKCELGQTIVSLD